MSAGPDPDLARLAARPRSAAADTVSAVLDPSSVLAVSVLLVCLRHAAGPSAALGWTLVVLVFVVGLPWLVLVLALRRGRVPDRHVVVRGLRHRVLWPAVLSVAAGLVLVVAVGAPEAVVELVVAVLVGAVGVSLVTLVWKVSVHTAVLAAAGTVLAAEVSPLLGYAVAPLLVLLGWARWRAGRHTLAQVLGGAVLGTASAGLAMAL